MAITVVAPAPTQLQAGPRGHANQLPLQDCNFYRWSLSVGADNDTFDTKLHGIVETAITGTRTAALATVPAFASGDCTIASISTAGVVTFSVAGATTLDLLVWAK